MRQKPVIINNDFNFEDEFQGDDVFGNKDQKNNISPDQ